MDEKTVITLKLVGFNEVELSNLKAVLTLAERALQKQWQIVETATADFFLLSVASAEQHPNNDSLQALPIERCIFCVEQPKNQAHYELLLDDKHIPRLQMLVNLLNRIGSHATTAQPVAQSPIAKADSTQESILVQKQDCFDPAQGLLGYLLQPTNHYLVVTLNNQIDCLGLYINHQQQVYYTHNTQEQLEAYLLATDTLFIKSYTAEEFTECIEAENLKPQPLKNLIWHGAILLSKGKVLHHYAPEHIVRLKSWPDLRLPRCMEYAKLAAFMKNNAATLPLVAQELSVPLAQVHDFYNACYLIGIIEKADTLAIVKKIY